MKNSLKLTTKDLFGNYDNLGYACEAGYVLDKDHPELPLTLYVYDNSCVFEHKWDDVTMQCRGLVTGPNWEIVALPFPKSFLVDVHAGGAPYALPLPSGPFRVTTKVDGSLAIIFWYEDPFFGGQWHVASKGSFNSDHAKWGQAYLADKNLDGLDRTLTYLAEMIIPDWGRIVVNNGDKADMVLLGARSLYTGGYASLDSLEWTWQGIGSVVKSWGMETDPVALSELIKDNHRPDGTAASGLEFEGVVLQWPDGTMAKAKLEDYISLHGLFTETSELGIWRVLSSGQEPDTLMSTAPDEMVNWIKSVVADLRSRRAALLDEVHREFIRVQKRAQALAVPFFPERKEFAQAAMGSPFSKVLFLLLDDNADKLDNWLWKQVRPVGKTTFRKVEEEITGE